MLEGVTDAEGRVVANAVDAKGVRVEDVEGVAKSVTDAKEIVERSRDALQRVTRACYIIDGTAADEVGGQEKANIGGSGGGRGKRALRTMTVYQLIFRLRSYIYKSENDTAKVN